MSFHHGCNCGLVPCLHLTAPIDRPLEIKAGFDLSERLNPSENLIDSAEFIPGLRNTSFTVSGTFDPTEEIMSRLLDRIDTIKIGEVTLGGKITVDPPSEDDEGGIAFGFSFEAKTISGPKDLVEQIIALDRSLIVVPDPGN